MEDNNCSDCQNNEELHECTYKVDINNDYTLCNCCEYCTQQCIDGI